MGAVTDVITGRVTMLPFSICCYSGPMVEGFDSVIGKLTSRLIVFSGQRNEKGLNETHFYEFDGREFRFIMPKAATPDPSREPDPAPTPPVENSPLSASNLETDCKKLTGPKARLSCYDNKNRELSSAAKADENVQALKGKAVVRTSMTVSAIRQ